MILRPFAHENLFNIDVCPFSVQECVFDSEPEQEAKSNPNEQDYQSLSAHGSGGVGNNGKNDENSGQNSTPTADYYLLGSFFFFCDRDCCGAGICKTDCGSDTSDINDPVEAGAAKPRTDQRNEKQEVGCLGGSSVFRVQFSEGGRKRICTGHGIKKSAGRQIKCIHARKNGTQHSDS